MSNLPRRTPYELVFIEGEFESRLYPQIAEEVGEGFSSLQRDSFDFVRTAGEIVRDLVTPEAPPEALEQYRALLFHAFHFWAEDRPLYVIEPATARYLVEAPPTLEDWRFRSPRRSLYLQLPANLFWSSISPDAAPEPVDGVFITLTAGEDPLGEDYDHLDVLVVLGIHRARAGFSVIPLATEIGSGMDNPWCGEQRSGGDFANELPGGELSGLYSIMTTAEVLKLVARALWYADRFPDAMVEAQPQEARTADGEPPPTQLSHVLLTLAKG